MVEGEARVLPGPQPRKSQTKSGVTGIISNPFLAKLTIISFSDFSSKESLNLWGKVQADAKFPSHDG